MSTKLKREAEASLQVETDGQAEETARRDALAVQEMESRALVAQSEVFGKVKRVAAQMNGEYSRLLEGADDMHEVARAQGGKIALRRLIDEFENALRTTP